MNRNVLSIARREFATYFNSPIAYIVLGVFLAVAGWLFFFFSGLFIAGKATMRPFFSFAPLLFMFVVPAVTMRLIADERKTGTLEMLMTLPLKDYEIVLGKFFAALAMLSLGLVLTFIWPISLSMVLAKDAALDWGPIAGGYIGLVLLAGAFVAAGMWASSLSKNQIVGFILGLGICFVLWVLDKATIVLPSSLAAPLQYLSVTYHFENIARGVIDTRDVLYYITATTIGLMLTTRTLANVRK